MFKSHHGLNGTQGHRKWRYSINHILAILPLNFHSSHRFQDISSSSLTEYNGVTCFLESYIILITTVILHSHFHLKLSTKGTAMHKWCVEMYLSYLKIAINVVKTFRILRKLGADIFRIYEDAFQVRPRSLHFKPDADHLVGGGELFLPNGHLVQEMIDVL